MGDFFAFRRMLAPLLIHLFFWIGTLGSIGLGVLMLLDKTDLVLDPLNAGAAKDFWKGMDSNGKMLLGFIVLIGGPFLFRIYSELLMLPFRMNASLTDIRKTLMEQQEAREARAAAVPVARR